SSDVCSSDLTDLFLAAKAVALTDRKDSGSAVHVGIDLGMPLLLLPGESELPVGLADYRPRRASDDVERVQLGDGSKASHANVATQCEDMYSSETAASRPGAMRSSTRVSIPLACSMSDASPICSAIV